jgi:hypothetical protein
VKDAANECTMFAPIVTVARDGVQGGNGGYGYGYGNGSGNGSGTQNPARVVDTSAQAPRNASDARAAFDSLFKK